MKKSTGITRKPRLELRREHIRLLTQSELQNVGGGLGGVFTTDMTESCFTCTAGVFDTCLKR